MSEVGALSVRWIVCLCILSVVHSDQLIAREHVGPVCIHLSKEVAVLRWLTHLMRSNWAVAIRVYF